MMSFMVSYIVINSVYQTHQCVVRLYAVERCLYRYKNKLLYRKNKKKKEKKERERRTADERSRAILHLRRCHSVIKASAELSTNRDKDFQQAAGSTTLVSRAHCCGNHVIYVRVAMPQCRVLLCPRPMALHAKDTGLIILYVSPQLKCGPVTTTQSVTVAVISVTHTVDFLYLRGTVFTIWLIFMKPSYMRFSPCVVFPTQQ
jgi:hypothetical protein